VGGRQVLDLVIEAVALARGLFGGRTAPWLRQRFRCDTGSICTVNTGSEVSVSPLLRTTEGSPSRFAYPPTLTRTGASDTAAEVDDI
jgi:hypothetical protein